MASEMFGGSKKSRFEKGLDTWVNEVTDEEKELRQEAMNRMIKLKNNKSLNQLSLSDLKLSSLPEQLWELDKLRELDLSHNKLENLPDKIGNLINLSCLRLGNNNLKTIPYSLLNPSKFDRFITLEKNSIPESEVNNLNSKIKELEPEYVLEDSGRFEDPGKPAGMSIVILDMSSQKGCAPLGTDGIKLHLTETYGTEIPNSTIEPPFRCNKLAAFNKEKEPQNNR